MVALKRRRSPTTRQTSGTRTLATTGPVRAVPGSHVRLPAPSNKNGQDRPLPMRLRPQERRRPGTAGRAKLESLSGFRLTAGQQSSRAESAICGLGS